VLDRKLAGLKTGQSIWKPLWMSRAKVSVELTAELLRALDERAAREKRSRSAMIRDAVKSYLYGQDRNQITREIIEGYERIPPTDEGDPW
jgi:predicted transcriptional regulator